MTEARNTAGVIAPPPLIALGAVIVGLALDWLLPAYVLSALLTRNGRIVIGVLLIAAGSHRACRPGDIRTFWDPTLIPTSRRPCW